MAKVCVCRKFPLDTSPWGISATKITAVRQGKRLRCPKCEGGNVQQENVQGEISVPRVDWCRLANSLKVEVLEVEMNFHDAGCFDPSAQYVLLSGRVVASAQAVQVVQETDTQQCTSW